jgi:hypothetical protein
MLASLDLSRPTCWAGWAGSWAAQAGEKAGLPGWLGEDLRNQPMAGIEKRNTFLFFKSFINYKLISIQTKFKL